MTLTLVTSLLNYYHTPLPSRTLTRRLTFLRKLMEPEVPLVIYVSPDLGQPLHDYIQEHFPHNNHIRMVCLQKPLFESSYAFLVAKQFQLDLPKERLPPKDTWEYLCYLHSKIGFIHHVATSNPFHTAHMAWLDCDIARMWRDVPQCQRCLRHLHTHGLQPVRELPPTETAPGRPITSENELYIPSCWSYEKRSMAAFRDRVCWRFMTNFFLGTTVSIQRLYRLYTEHYEAFLKKNSVLPWDMNFWAYLEQETDWAPIAYRADHNDSMLRQFPVYALCHQMHES